MNRIIKNAHVAIKKMNFSKEGQNVIFLFFLWVGKVLVPRNGEIFLTSRTFYVRGKQKGEIKRINKGEAEKQRPVKKLVRKTFPRVFLTISKFYSSSMQILILVRLIKGKLVETGVTYKFLFLGNIEVSGE